MKYLSAMATSKGSGRLMEVQHLRRLVVLIGAPRSGTTAFLDIASGLDFVRVLNEPRLLWRTGQHYRRSDYLSAPTQRARGKMRRALAELVPPSGLLVEKTPANVLRPEYLLQVVPEAHFIVRPRDPTEVEESLVRMFERASTVVDPGRLTGGPSRIRSRLAEGGGNGIFYIDDLFFRLLARATGGKIAPLWGPRIARHRRLALRGDQAAIASTQAAESARGIVRALELIPPSQCTVLNIARFEFETVSSILTGILSGVTRDS